MNLIIKILTNVLSRYIDVGTLFLSLISVFRCLTNTFVEFVYVTVLTGCHLFEEVIHYVDIT